ncbi:methionine aminopeptidase 1D, mitochondrial-like isoform X2 [Symsagittifera roscoffensis]|uniref:methionine aminopeptidase 1D, mitochondrial-like isoform X2 n=1 Tax=Symsagittifera roscoffensis TaxID=84072 RepID=UPI00307C4478
MQALKRIARTLGSRPSMGGLAMSRMTEEELTSHLAQCHFNIVLPGRVRKLYDVPSTVPKPYYVAGRLDHRRGVNREVHLSEAGLDGMREAGVVARHVLQLVANSICEGISCEEIDLLVYNEAIKCGAYPSPLAYKGFPKSCCTSINNIVCHGIPDDTRLRNSDIINVDVTLFVDGYHGDTSRTFVVGEVLDQSGRDLVSVCEQIMLKGIESCTPGNTVFDVQKSFQSELDVFLAKNPDCKFVFDSNFCSHGIGSEFHAAPNLHTKLGSGDTGHTFVEGQTLTIEPILMECDSPVTILEDGWTCTSTVPLARSAQFEHTVLITKNGPEILT